MRFANSDLNVVVRGLVASLGDDSIDVAGSAPVNIIFTGNETSITRQVLLVVLGSSVVLTFLSRHYYFQLLIKLILKFIIAVSHWQLLLTTVLGGTFDTATHKVAARSTGQIILIH